MKRRTRRDKMRESAWARLASLRNAALAVMREAADDSKNPQLQHQAQEYLRSRGLLEAGAQVQGGKSGALVPTHEVSDL